jgi:hypothetical protein
MSDVMSPGRRRALELSGGNIRPDVQHTAPDGQPIGPGASEQAAAKAEQFTQADADVKPAPTRPMPFARK